MGRDSLCPRVCLPGPRTGHSGATSLHGRTESNAVRKEGLYHSARSPRGNRYIITPRGSYIDYSIENDSLTATSDGVCPPPTTAPAHAPSWPLVQNLARRIPTQIRTEKRWACAVPRNRGC